MTDADKNHDSDEEIKAYKTFVKTVSSKSHKVYLGETFNAPKEYVLLFNELENAKEGDEFIFYLNSYGGRLDSGIQFANKLATTKAHTKSIVEAPCYSMGAIFPFLTNEVEMLPHTFLMFHDASSGFGRQKMNEIELNVNAFRTLFLDILQTHCSAILSDEEIASIGKGQDVYLTNKDVALRLEQKQRMVTEA